CLRSCGGSLVASWSIASRNAASVLPEPVGAITSASLPVAAARQAPSCAAVGPLKAALNHALVGAENSSSTWLTSPILTDGTDDPDTVCRVLPRAGRRHGSIQAALTVEADEGSAVRVLSIDLGTSNTVAVLAEDGRSPRVVDVDGSATMPSAVYAGEDGTLLVGRDAERRARLDPSRFEPNPKRRIDDQTLLLGTDVIPVSEALAAVLRRVLSEVTRQLGGTQPDEVRLTHPAQWGPTRRAVLMSAAKQAGITGAITLVPEPVAAAAHFASFPGHALAPGQALAVYDLGAGTFDAAVVGATQDGGFTVLAEDGLSDLGGLDVDQALLVHVGRSVSHKDPQRWQRLLRPETTADRRARRALQEDVKAAKEALSRHPQTEVPMPEPFTDVLVTRGELEALVRPAMLRSVELMSRT